jgi:thioesterase domain-containing protein
LVHDSFGDLSYASVLARYLAPGIPIYGLPAKPLHEHSMRTVEGMAMRLVQMVREAQATGPYRLAGWSVGGVLAYEIAIQLIGADETVQFVGLLDSVYTAGANHQTKPPSNFDDKEQLLSIVRQQVQCHPTLYRDERIQAAISELSSSSMVDFAAMLRKFQELSLVPGSWTEVSANQIHQLLARAHLYVCANAQYCAQRIPVPVNLFVSESNGAGSLRGWNAVLPQSQIRLWPMRGTHSSMIETPNVEKLGQDLSCTMADMAAQSRELPEKKYMPLATLQTGRSKTAPLFCIPGAGASVGGLVELANSLDERQAIYGFEPRGMDGTLVPHATVPAAAECYLRALREACAKGPVHLLGHSYGGWVAFEMAKRLSEEGRDVLSLTILDSDAPDEIGAVREYTPCEMTMAWISIFELLLDHPLGISEQDLVARSEAARLELIHGRLVSEGLMPRRSKPEVLHGMLQTFARSLRTYFNPRTPYSGPSQLILVRDSKMDAETDRRRREDCASKWRQWAPNLICLQAPGNHITALKSPHVIELARMVRNTTGAATSTV